MSTRTTNWSIVLIALLLMRPSELAADDSSKTAADFDADGNGLIVADEAKQAFLYLVQKDPAKHLKKAANVDKDGDGSISTAEAKAYSDAVKEFIAFELDGYTSLSVEEFNDRYFRSTSDRFRLPILVRKSFDELPAYALTETAPADQVAADFKKANPAVVSYTHDFNDGSDTWQLEGVIMRPFSLCTSQTELAGLVLLPSASFNRLSTEAKDKEEVDAFTPRVTLEGKWFLPDFGMFFRGTASYATDFGLDDGVVAGEFEWEPVFHWLANGVTQPVPLLDRWLEYRLRNILHFETGEVVAEDGQDNLEKGDRFNRLGPKVQADLFPVPSALDRLAFSLTWTYLPELAGNLGESKLFAVGMKYQLDPIGHFNLTAEYKNGDVPLLKQETDQFLTGFGVKF